MDSQIGQDSREEYLGWVVIDFLINLAVFISFDFSDVLLLWSLLTSDGECRNRFYTTSPTTCGVRFTPSVNPFMSVGLWENKKISWGILSAKRSSKVAIINCPHGNFWLVSHFTIHYYHVKPWMPVVLHVLCSRVKSHREQGWGQEVLSEGIKAKKKIKILEKNMKKSLKSFMILFF